MESWHLIYALSVIQSLFFLVRYTKTQVDLLSPSTISAMVLLFWFYPKVPDLATHHFFATDTIADFLVFWLLCQTALFIGTNLSLQIRFSRWTNTIHRSENYHRWNVFSIILFFIGAIAFYQYSRLPPEMLYMRQPSGIITILIFFSSFLTVSLMISVFSYLRKRHWLSLIPIVVGGLLYAERILIHGKRTELFELTFLIAVATVIYLNRRVSWPVIVGAGLLIISLNAVVSDYREIMKAEERQIASLADIPLRERIVESAFRADHDIVNAVVTFEAYRSPRQNLRLGADYWNVIVSRYVPAQIVGAGVKNALRIDTKDALWNELLYTAPTGTTTFSAGGAFANFGWFGFIVFFLYGLIMRFLYLGARYRSVHFSVLYVYFGALIPVTLIFGLDAFVAPVILWIPLITVMARFASCRSRPDREWVKQRYASASH